MGTGKFWLYKFGGDKIFGLSKSLGFQQLSNSVTFWAGGKTFMFVEFYWKFEDH